MRIEQEIRESLTYLPNGVNYNMPLAETPLSCYFLPGIEEEGSMNIDLCFEPTHIRKSNYRFQLVLSLLWISIALKSVNKMRVGKWK